jgi:hypothetical protein
MKKILKFIPLAIITLFFVACQDIDKDPWEINGTDGPFGSFIRLDITTAAVLDVTDIANTSFGGTLTNPSNNVASWTVEARRVSSGESSDYVPLVTITSFPAEFIATPASLAALFGLTANDLIPGDRFDFVATSIGTDGSVVTFDQFGPNLQGNTGMAQGYKFNTFLSCPFIQADALGSYAVVTNGGFFGYLSGAGPIEVIAGNTANDIIMVDPMGHLVGGDAPDKYNVEININAGSGQATIVSQSAWDSGNPVCCGTPYGPGFIEGGGFVFSCAGAIVINIDCYCVAAGSFGSGPYVLQKI